MWLEARGYLACTPRLRDHHLIHTLWRFPPCGDLPLTSCLSTGLYKQSRVVILSVVLLRVIEPLSLTAMNLLGHGET